MIEELPSTLFVPPEDPDDGKAGNPRHLRSVRVKLPLAERDKPYSPPSPRRGSCRRQIVGCCNGGRSAQPRCTRAEGFPRTAPAVFRSFGISPSCGNSTNAGAMEAPVLPDYLTPASFSGTKQKRARPHARCVRR
jgi:hypothetical protein